MPETKRSCFEKLTDRQNIEVIEELIKFAKQIDAATKCGEELGLTDDEIAFYDALAANESAMTAKSDEKLKVIAAWADHAGDEERDHRLDPSRKRPRQGQGDD